MKNLNNIFRNEFGNDFPFQFYYMEQRKKIIIDSDGYNPDGTILKMTDHWKEHIIKTFKNVNKKWDIKPNFDGGITITIK